MRKLVLLLLGFLVTAGSLSVVNIAPGAQAQALSGATSAATSAQNIDTGALVTLSDAGTSGASADQINAHGRGLQLGIDIAAISGTGATLTVSIEGKDTASGQYYTMLTSAALTSAGFTWLTLYPSALANADSYVSQVLPRTWRISYAITGASPSVTATIGASVIN